MSDVDQGAEPRLPLAGDEDQARRKRARRRVEAIKGFYIHLLVFVLVVAGLLAVNLVAGGPWWVLWVVFGWGIGVLAHAIAVLGSVSRAIANWERRKLEQFMAEDR